MEVCELGLLHGGALLRVVDDITDELRGAVELVLGVGSDHHMKILL
jgi:hypothetical protein